MIRLVPNESRRGAGTWRWVSVETENKDVESEMQFCRKEITYMTQADLSLDLSVHVTSVMRGTREVLLLTTDVWFLHVGLGVS